MSTLSFHIRGWSAWAPGLETAAAWREWAGQPDAVPTETIPAVPVLLRRRVSPLGQQALKAGWSLPASSVARLVLCSRHGEVGRTMSILDSLVADTEVSPADFTLSVHNALAGLLSIARGNRHGHTMISAGEESFEFGLLESIACLTERPDEPVVLVYFDPELPPPFDVFRHPAAEPLALALSLAMSGGEPFTLTTHPSPGTSTTVEPAPLAFLRFMLGNQPAMVTVGERLVWRWGREDAAA